MLIYKRLARIGIRSKARRAIERRNNAVAIYIWTGTAAFILPSLFIWRSSFWLVVLTLVFLLCYVWLYFRVIRLRAPIWLVLSAKIHGP